MTQPVLNVVSNFDATKTKMFTFVYLGPKSTTKNQLQIRENVQGSKPIYSAIQDSIDKNHLLPDHKLTNGKSYVANIRVVISGDPNLEHPDKDTATYSEWSADMYFSCYDEASLYFDTIDQNQYIYTDDVLMSVLYSQKQNEPVKSYQFTLYDQRHVVLQDYPLRTPKEGTTRLSERMSGLEKGKLYYAGIKVFTKNGMIYEKEQEFVAQYLSPSISGAVRPHLNKDDGQIIVSLLLKQLLGTSARAFIPNRNNDAPSHYSYWKDDYVIVPKNNPLMYTKLGMAKARGWVAKIWLMNVQNGIFLDFAPRFGEGQHIKFVKHDDYVTCEKTSGRVKYVTRSNKIQGLGLKPFYLYIRVHEFRVEINIQDGQIYEPDSDSSTNQYEKDNWSVMTKDTEAYVKAQQAKIAQCLAQLKQKHDSHWSQYSSQISAAIVEARNGNYDHDKLRQRIQEIDDVYWNYFEYDEMVNYWKDLTKAQHETEASLMPYRIEYLDHCYYVLQDIKSGKAPLSGGRDKLNQYNTAYGMILNEVINFDGVVLTLANLAKEYNKYIDSYEVTQAKKFS